MAAIYKKGGSALISLCHRQRITDLIGSGALVIAGIDSPGDAFLDDLRIGLRLQDQMIKIKGPVDLKAPGSALNSEVFQAEGGTLEPGTLYLGISRERFSLPRNVYGLINTRSKYARRGLEIAGSSTFVIPGFGMAEPSPIVFEITVPYALTGLNSNDAHGFLLLFETDFEVSAEVDAYSGRFPMSLLSSE